MLRRGEITDSMSVIALLHEAVSAGRRHREMKDEGLKIRLAESSC